MSDPSPVEASQKENMVVIPSDEDTDTAGSSIVSSRSKRRLRYPLLLLGPLLVAAAASYFYFTGGRYVTTENAYVKADKVMIAAEVSGLIAEVAVHENQPVEKGDILFRIDDGLYRIAISEVEAGLANVRDEIAGLKAEYQQKLEERALAKTNIAFAKKEFDRQTRLIATNAVSRSKLDSTRHDLDISLQQIRVIDQEAAQIRAQLGGDHKLPIEQHSHYQTAMAAKSRAELDLKHTVIRAPFDGIAGNTPQVGQQVIGKGAFSSPVMSLVATNDIWIEANFKETDLTYVMPGQSVAVRVDTYPGKEWKGTIQSLSQATGAEFSVIPPQNATGNWVKVVQRIPVRIAVEANEDDPPLRAGMSTFVEIDTERKRPLPEFAQTALIWFNIMSSATADEAESRR